MLIKKISFKNQSKVKNYQQMPLTININGGNTFQENALT